MSESAPESPARPAAPPGKKENVLTRKLGPLPTWAWVAIVAAILIGYFYLKNKQSGSTTGTGTGAGQIPQFVNQVYTSVLPPSAPVPAPDKDGGRDRDHGPRWKDESRKDRRIRHWEHKHPGQEYPFNSWQGNPTAAELAAFNAQPTYQPLTQAAVAPAQNVGPLGSPANAPAQVVPNPVGPPQAM